MKKICLFLSLLLTICLTSCGGSTTEINRVINDNSTLYNTDITNAYEKASKCSVSVLRESKFPFSETVKYSGVVVKIDDDYAYILTYYLIGDVSQSVTISYDDTDVNGTIISKDNKNGFVLIKVASTSFSFEACDANIDTISKGQDAIVVAQTSNAYSNYLNKGYVSFYDDFLISTDAPTNSQTLGAGIFDINGKLLGIICQEETGTLEYEETFFQGMCYAVRSNHILTIVDQMIQISSIERPLMGITVSFVNKDLALELDGDYNLPDDDFHEVISDITPNSNGDTAGFEVGDVLMTVNGKTLNDRSILTAIMRTSVIGSSLHFTVMRFNSNTKTFTEYNIYVTLNN